MYELIDSYSQGAVIKVIGVGGGGGNAVQHMVDANVEAVEFVCANTDAQAMMDIGDGVCLQLGTDITKGLGAGADPDVGRKAAMEDKDRLEEVIRGADMLFITAGMGGGTGTGAAPVVAQVAKELGILTVAVVTKPFGFEGDKRMKVAEAGIAELSQYVDSLITIPNEKLLDVLPEDVGLMEAFGEANNVLLGAVQGIADLITRPGQINVDFADVRTVMSEMGMAMMGSGSGTGADRARDAAESAVASPLLENVNLTGARGILVNVAASKLTLREYSIVGDTIKSFASPDANIVIGTAVDPDLGEEVRVTVVATGLGGVVQKQQEAAAVIEMVKPAVVGDSVDYDIPTMIRKNPAIVEEPKTMNKEDYDFLDVPAFLRRQAD